MLIKNLVPGLDIVPDLSSGIDLFLFLGLGVILGCGSEPVPDLIIGLILGLGMVIHENYAKNKY